MWIGSLLFELHLPVTDIKSVHRHEIVVHCTLGAFMPVSRVTDDRQQNACFDIGLKIISQFDSLYYF